MSDVSHPRRVADAVRPGFALDRMVTLMRQAIERLGLDLADVPVLTEAASGAYASTAVLAALAGADWVYAVARDSRHGSCGDLARQTLALARAAGVADRVEIVIGPPYAAASKSLIVTHSDGLHPLDAETIARLPSTAVVALMHGGREQRDMGLDLLACSRRGIPVVTVNEHHPQAGTFPYLGCLAVRELHDAGFAVHGCRIALLSDAEFAPCLRLALERLGGRVALAARCADLPPGPFDALLVAMSPRGRDAFSVDELLEHLGPLPVVQFSGALDRTGVADAGVSLWPPAMSDGDEGGIDLSAIGPDLVIGRTAAVWRAAELVLRHGPGAATRTSPALLVRQSFDHLNGRP